MLSIRKAARIIVINEYKEVLLVKYEDATPADPTLKVNTYWVPPGGGVSNRESYRNAAIRELFEETSISVSWAEPIWFRERELIRKGELTLYKERYFVTHISGCPIPKKVDKDEPIVDCRWFSLSELERLNAMIFPANFVQYLRPLISGEIPQKPFYIERKTD